MERTKIRTQGLARSGTHVQIRAKHHGQKHSLEHRILVSLVDVHAALPTDGQCDDPFHHDQHDYAAKSSTSLVTGHATTTAKQPASTTTAPVFVTVLRTVLRSGYVTRFQIDMSIPNILEKYIDLNTICIHKLRIYCLLRVDRTFDFFFFAADLLLGALTSGAKIDAIC